MSILDTFYILFESNADQVKKGYDEAEKSGKKFESSLRTADEQIHRVGASFIEAAKGIGAAFIGAFAVEHVADAVFEVAEMTDALGKSAKAMDVNIEDMDAWGQAAQRSGGTAEGFNQSLMMLNRGLADMAAKGTSRSAPFFKELGIAMLDAHGKARPIMDLLPELADAFGKMTKQQSSGFAEKLGLDTGTMMLLQSGRRAVEDLVARQKMLGTVTKEDAEIAEKFNDQWDDTKQIFRNMYVAIGSEVLPALTWILKGFEHIAIFVRENKGLIEGFFIGLAGIITAVYGPAIISAAVATWAFLAPWLAIIGTILAVGLAFALVFDDVRAFMSGQQSVIGELSKQWPLLGDSVRAFVGVLQFSFDTIFTLINFLADVIVSGPSRAFQIAGERGEAAAARLKAAFGGFGKFLESVFTSATQPIVAAWDAVGAAIMRVWNTIRGAIGTVGKVLGAVGLGGALAASPAAAGVTAGQAALASTNTPIVSQTSSSIATQRGGDKHTAVTIGEVNVQTQATDADGISRAVGSSLDEQMRQTVDHFDDGVAG